jgi:hypothetical protein
VKRGIYLGFPRPLRRSLARLGMRTFLPSDFNSDEESAMKFLCLVYHNEAERDAIPQDEWEALMQQGFADGDELAAEGVFLGGQALQPVRTAVTLRRKRGELSFTDGPFAETNEQLGGFMMIEAPDLAAAKEIALRFSVGALGPLEIRPIWEREDLLAQRVTVGQEGEGALRSG